MEGKIDVQRIKEETAATNLTIELPMEMDTKKLSTDEIIQSLIKDSLEAGSHLLATNVIVSCLLILHLFRSHYLVKK